MKDGDGKAHAPGYDAKREAKQAQHDCKEAVDEASRVGPGQEVREAEAESTCERASHIQADAERLAKEAAEKVAQTLKEASNTKENK